MEVWVLNWRKGGRKRRKRVLGSGVWLQGVEADFQKGMVGYEIHDVIYQLEAPS